MLPNNPLKAGQVIPGRGKQWKESKFKAGLGHMLSLMGLDYIQWTEPASKSKKGAERLKAAKPSSPQKIKAIIIIQRKLQLGYKRHSGRHS